MTHEHTTAGSRFVNRAVTIACGGFSGVVVLTGLGGLSQGATIEGLVWVLVGFVFAYRGLRSATVLVTPTEVELRGFARTRHVTIGELSQVVVAIGRTGMNGFGREYLVLHRSDGTQLAFKELNAKPTKTADTVVQRAARAIGEAMGHGRP